jgi:outer membrane translocation and assembly module TamA
VATIERRYYSDWHLFNLVRVGAVGFIEAGKAWDGPIQGDNKVLADVGFGLRFSSSKARVGSVVHVDIATPLVEKDGIDEYQLLIEAKRQF